MCKRHIILVAWLALGIVLPAAASAQGNPARGRVTAAARARVLSQKPETISRVLRAIARRNGLPNVNYGTAEGFRHKFRNLAEKGFRSDSCFAADPKAANTQKFYKDVQRFADKNGLAMVGIGMVEEFSHAFCFAPVTKGGHKGRVMQMDGTDPALGHFTRRTPDGGREAVKTRIKPGVGEKMFGNQARALWLVPKANAIKAGNNKFAVVQSQEKVGVNCAEFSTGLLHDLHKQGVPAFKDFYAAHKAVVNPTGNPEHRGFAAGLMLAKPHLFVQHTSPEWQQQITKPENGASMQVYKDGKKTVRHPQTGPMNLTVDFQKFEL